MTPGLRLTLAVAAAAVLLRPSGDPPASYNAVVQQRILPQAATLLHQLVKEQRKLAIDGTPVFNGSAKFGRMSGTLSPG